jgi:transposase
MLSFSYILRTERHCMKARYLRIHYKTTEKLLQLMKEAEKDGQYRVAKRIHAVLLNCEGKTSSNIAHTVMAPRSKVSLWLSNYEQYGYESFLEGYRSGRPCGLNDKQKMELADIVDSGPVAYGFSSGIWTAVMIGNIIQSEFGIEYKARHVRRILHDLDFSVQRPKRVLANADPVLQNKWIRYTYPNIKKKLKI